MKLPGITLPIFVLYLIYLLLGGFFMYMGAKWAKIKNVTYIKSFLCVIISIFAQWVFRLYYPGRVGTIIGVIATLFLIEAIFETSFGKALLAWILTIVAEIIGVVVVFLIFGAVIFAF